jgi:hypothetical protein
MLFSIVQFMGELGLEEPAHRETASLAARFRVVEMLPPWLLFLLLSLTATKFVRTKVLCVPCKMPKHA